MLTGFDLDFHSCKMTLDGKLEIHELNRHQIPFYNIDLQGFLKLNKKLTVEM